jgi:amino acid transporter
VTDLEQTGGLGPQSGARPPEPPTGPQSRRPDAPGPGPRAPIPQGLAAEVPESLRYRLTNKLLGPPLVTEQLTTEKLGRAGALGVLSPDCISSSAYGTEEMLNQMVPYVGLAAFAMVVPITLAILGVLFFVTLSYLEVIQLYTKAGGSYVVARDNFGPKIAQIAAVALLIDYTVTVAVQTAAGTAALTSAFPSLKGLTVEITIAVVLLLLYGNLRGIREGAKFFAFPTYFFITSLGTLVIVGYIKEALGQLHPHPLPPPSVLGYTPGHPGNGLLMGLAFITLLRSFANGGSSLTGLEAISNGVASFKAPRARHARQVLVIMSSVLAFLVLGVTLLAKWTHAVPYAVGSPTVVSQEARYVFGDSVFGHTLFYVVQFATVLVLYTGANTSYNGFPYLASFVAGDSFLPRQLTRRGHRLAFSNGIIVLTVVAVILLLIFRAQVSGLVALYAIGVFTGFTMAGAGMVKHHLDHRGAHWRRSVVVNGFSAVLSASVVLIFAFAKFKEGAWAIVVIAPLLYFALIRLHREYQAEARQLEIGAAQACEAPILRRHVVVVLVDRLDMATARAIQYARTLTPDDLRAVHFDIDNKEARQLEVEWSRLGLSRLPLDIIECPDRRLTRAAVQLVSDAVSDGNTECTVLLPRREFATGWSRFLHDRTADRIAEAVGRVPHVSATIVPFNVRHVARAQGRRFRRTVQRTASPAPDGTVGPPNGAGAPGDGAPAAPADAAPAPPGRAGRAPRGALTRADRALQERAVGTRPISEAQWRQRVRVAGRVTSVRVQPRGGTSNLECVLIDPSGSLLLVFQGRPRIPGIEPGARLVVEGMVGTWGRRLAILNPDYELVAGPDREGDAGP